MQGFPIGINKYNSRYSDYYYSLIVWWFWLILLSYLPCIFFQIICTAKLQITA